MTATVDAAFGAALEQDANVTETAEPAVAPPPRKTTVVDPDAPHGRADDGTPHAPYGIGKNGRPRIKPAGPGRAPRGDDAPRVAAAPAAAPAALAGGAKDWSKDLDDLADGFWMVLSGLPARGALKVKLHAQAALLDRSKPGLVRAGNIAAQHHDPTAQLIEKLTSGSAAWMLPVMFATAPFVASSVAMWKTPAAELAELAEQNEQKFKAVMGAAVLEAAAAEAYAAQEAAA